MAGRGPEQRFCAPIPGILGGLLRRAQNKSSAGTVDFSNASDSSFSPEFLDRHSASDAKLPKQEGSILGGGLRSPRCARYASRR